MKRRVQFVALSAVIAAALSVELELVVGAAPEPLRFASNASDAARLDRALEWLAARGDTVNFEGCATPRCVAAVLCVHMAEEAAAAHGAAVDLAVASGAVDAIRSALADARALTFARGDARGGARSACFADGGTGAYPRAARVAAARAARVAADAEVMALNWLGPEHARAGVEAASRALEYAREEGDARAIAILERAKRAFESVDAGSFEAFEERTYGELMSRLSAIATRDAGVAGHEGGLFLAETRDYANERGPPSTAVARARAKRESWVHALLDALGDAVTRRDGAGGRGGRGLRALEVGFNSGHSAAMLLSVAPPDASLVAYDLCEHAYSAAARDAVAESFAGRFEIVCGDSTATLATAAAAAARAPSAAIPFDFVFVDGGHSLEVASADLRHVVRLARRGAKLVVDDCDLLDVHDAWRAAVDAGLVMEHYRGVSWNGLCIGHVTTGAGA